MERTEAYEQVKGLLDKLWNEGDMTGAEIARARELFATLKPSVQPIERSLCRLLHLVPSKELWDKTAELLSFIRANPEQIENQVGAAFPSLARATAKAKETIKSLEAVTVGKQPAQGAEVAWQPIETAPRDGSHLLLFRPDIRLTGYHAKAGWVINAPGLPLMEPAPTHWMPLPPDPLQR